MSASDTFGVGGTTAAGAGRRRAFRLVAWLAPAGLLLLAGCGAGKGDITGQVTYKGQPLSVGRITFVGQGGKQEAVSAYIKRGKYTVHKCPAGPVKISIESIEPPDPEKLQGTKTRIENMPMARGMKERMKIDPELEELASGPPLQHMVIPLKYANPETSGLTYQVKWGAQEHNIDLTPE